MVFARDTEVALAAAAALVNTGEERLSDGAALEKFFQMYGLTGKWEGTEDELRALQQLRPRLRRIWGTDDGEVVGIVNTLLRESNALPQLVRQNDCSYHLHATPSNAPRAARIAVDVAMAFVDLIRSHELDRLRICAYPACRNVLIDLSKNRSKRFCDAGCGNRSAVTAYRARKAVKTS